MEGVELIQINDQNVVSDISLYHQTSCIVELLPNTYMYVQVHIQYMKPCSVSSVSIIKTKIQPLKGFIWGGGGTLTPS